MFSKCNYRCDKANMQGNSNRSSDGFGSTQDQNGSQYEIYDHAQNIPITAQPQQLGRGFNQQMTSAAGGLRNSDFNTNLHLNQGGVFVQNIRPWLKTTQPSDRNSRINSSESVVINFDESTSHSVDLYGNHQSRPSQAEFQDISSVDPETANSQQNSSNHARESNSDEPHHNINFFNYPHNSNQNTLIRQTSEGTQGENPSLNINSGNQSLEIIFNKCIPFITFLSLKAIYDHREGILIFAGLLVTFIHANSVVKREIAKQSRRSFFSLGIIFTNLFVSICFIYFVFQDQKLYKNLIFIPPYFHPISIWDVLWIVGITDFVLKFITIQLKVGMTCFPAGLLPYSSRGKWYLMLERTSQLYRGLAPIQPWLFYLMEAYGGPESRVGMFFSVAYVVSKGSDIMSKAKLFLKAFLKLLHHASFGVRPSNEELMSAGTQCPICHDEFNSPIILQCRHVFCEGCVSTWFDREQTCPLCRAKIADDPSWRDGATSLFTQLF